MNCQQAEQRLQELLDSRSDLETDVQLQNHFDGCADCRRMADEFSILFGSGANSDLLSVCSASSFAGTSNRRGSMGRRMFRTFTAFAAVFVLGVLPTMWGVRESTRDAGRESMVASSFVQSDDAQIGKPVFTDQLSADGAISVASVLDIGSAFNSLSMIATDDVSADSIKSEDRRATDSDVNSIGRMLTSMFPSRSLSQNKMPGESESMDVMNGDSVMSDLMQPLQFQQPTFKEILRVCSNPFSQS